MATTTTTAAAKLMPLAKTTRAAALARALIQFPSVTPNDFGCQELIATRLQALGFATETLNYHDVTNLWAVRHGQNGSSNNKEDAQTVPKGRLVVFCGHTDVVPSGPPEHWTHPPFQGDIDNGILHGRGAVDMKGGLASFIVALERFVNSNPVHDGSIGLILTSDEEGEAEYGTKEVLKELTKRGIKIDMCIVGEPSSREFLGDTVKVGRRAWEESLSSYPHLAKNPVHESLGALLDLVNMKWDEGTQDFHPTTFQISNIAGGTGAKNVIPGHKTTHFNLRFSPASTVESLKKRVEEVMEKHELDFQVNWHEISLPYETKRDSELVLATLASVRHVTGKHAHLCTSGGTSDGRFVATTGAQVVELGPINKTIHKVNEQTTVADLETLADIYEDLLERLLPDLPATVMTM